MISLHAFMTMKKSLRKLLLPVVGLLALYSCEDTWQPAMTSVEAGKATLKIRTIDDATNAAMSNVLVAVYGQPRGQEAPSLVFEGRSDDNGILTLPDFDVPSLVQLQVIDSRYPTAPPVTSKVLSENSASLVLQVSKTWNETHIYDRTNFEVLAVSSQNGTSAGSNVLLDNTATWHTQYSPVLHDFPHWLILDMKESKEIHGFAFKQRNNNNGPIRGVSFYISDDNQQWKEVLTTEVPYTNPGVWHVLTLGDVDQARYVKFEVTSGHLETAKFINLEQFGVF